MLDLLWRRAEFFSLQAKEQLSPDATAVYVAAGQAAGAIEEAVAAEIPLIVAVAEHIPLHDQLRVRSKCPEMECLNY